MTTTSQVTLQDALNQARPGTVESALQLLENFADMLVVTDDATFDGGGTVDHIVLPAVAREVWSVCVLTTAGGKAAAGARIIGDSSVTPSGTVVKLGDDNQTLTFEHAVKTVRVKYLKAASGDLTAAMAASAP